MNILFVMPNANFYLSIFPKWKQIIGRSQNTFAEMVHSHNMAEHIIRVFERSADNIVTPSDSSGVDRAVSSCCIMIQFPPRHRG